MAHQEVFSIYGRWRDAEIQRHGLAIQERGEMMYQTDIICALTSLPATDLNFASELRKATNLQIKMSIEVMRNREGKDKGRITACERELKRREK